MRLLIIECGNSKLPFAITSEAATLNPKPAMVSTITLNMDKFVIPEFKNMLFHLAPDTIILDPPQIDVPHPEKWAALLREVVRHTEMLTGRVLLVSSVEVLGDAQLRTEAAVAMPYSDIGMFLQSTETVLEESTSRHYIMRFPYTSEDTIIQSLITSPPKVGTNDAITLITLEDMATVILDRVQRGWYGVYHVTPNDFIVLSQVTDMEWDDTKRIPDHSLLSRNNWQVMKSGEVWKKLCEASKTPVC